MPNKPAAQVRKCLHSVFGHQTAKALGRTPPPPGPQIPGDADAGFLRPRKGWRAGVLLAPDVGIATCALPRGALVLAAIAVAISAALGRTPPAWSPDLTLAQVVAQDRAPVCPGGAGASALAQVVAQVRAPVCPGGAGGEECLRFRRRMWCLNIQYGGPCEGGSANFQRRGARISHPWVHGGQAGGVQPGAGARFSKP